MTDVNHRRVGASPRTRMLARVIGPYLVIAPLTIAVRAPQMQTLLSDFAASPIWGWFGGALTLLLGLIVVAVHPYWNDTPAIVISVLGWLMVLRGVLLLAFPSALMSAANAVLGTGSGWRIGYVALALVGVYLTVVGWRGQHLQVRGHGSRPGDR